MCDPAGGAGASGGFGVVHGSARLRNRSYAQRMPAALALERVSVEIDDALVLADVELAVDEAAITVLLGPSGAGKSTLLRLCNRLEVPTRGIVRYRGDDIAGLDPLWLRRRVGMVFQRPTPFPGTVADNLAVAAPDASDDEVAESLQRAALPSAFLHRDVDGLSGGEAQRACLARTLITRPDVLLMDEPTASVDADNVGLLEAAARDLVRHGTTIVWVTHDLAQADRVADDIVKLEHGRVVG